MQKKKRLHVQYSNILQLFQHQIKQQEIARHERSNTL